ncbi:polysaccharide biosynthesis tyrosine autokinase [Mucilaginibacter sp. Bleaf8]|uniref:GumC family protein n=1 Tax=Mucilaginibacter sp. Bleaf8 TaxID=2834430 RepID=UPI001BD124E5|nr:tyrosine-protein kinase [Mucilaginibacter sp. Bleaf8]MBS7566450.1 polysaccharide biosynthesis tyrosine autokinase [Mucilaginibacter sp. Bleaf8]
MSNFNEVSEYQVEDNANHENSLSDAAAKYLRHWKWFLLSLTVFLTIGYFYVKSQVPVYRVQADILIKDNSQSPDKDILSQLNINPSNLVIDNEIQILKSHVLAERAVKTLGLQTTYYDKGKFRKRFLYKNSPLLVELLQESGAAYGTEWSIQMLNSNEALFNGKRIAIGKEVSTDAGIVLIKPITGKLNTSPFFVIFNQVKATALQYGAAVSIAPVSKQGSVLTLTTEDAIPERGKDFLNQLIYEYNKAGIEDKNKNTSNTLYFIEGRLKDLVGELDQSEKKVQIFKAQNNITDISAQSQAFLSSVQTNDAQLSKIQLQLGVLKNIETYIQTSDKKQVRLPSLLGMEDPTIMALVQQLGDVILKRESLLQTIPETNPVVASMNDQIDALKRNLIQTIVNVRSGLLVSKRQLETQSKVYESGIKQVPVKERGLLDVMRQQDIKNNLFNFLLQKREETAMALASTVSDSRVINEAISSPVPIRPVKSTLYLTFFLLGLAVPFGIIFLKEMLNNKVRKKAEIEALTRVPVLGQISHSEEDDAMITVAKPRSMVAEQIRALRTNLQFIIPDEKGKIILFTSSVSGEGKSFIALNLSASLASTGKKVIVLELDLRRPKLLSTLGLEKKVGLSDYLIDRVTVENIIRPVPLQENLYIIESGTIPPNPAELLVNGNLTTLINQLKQEYDYILLDAPPVGLVTDAQILSRYADATFFLIRFNYTTKNNVRLLNDINKRRTFKNLNIIFNSVDYTGLGYGYKYDYGYYEEGKPSKRTIFGRNK